MEEWAGNPTILVGDVDCTAEGKPLCNTHGVSGFPTIQYGDPNDLEKYQGGRDFASLNTFTKGLKPLCSPANLDLCDDDAKAKIAEIQALSDDDLAAQIAEGETKIADAEASFKTEVDKLQAAYQELDKQKKAGDIDDKAFKEGVAPLQASYNSLNTAKQATISEVKASGLGLLKSVAAYKKQAVKEEL